MQTKLNLHLLSYITVIQKQIFGNRRAKFCQTHLWILGGKYLPHVKKLRTLQYTNMTYHNLHLLEISKN